MKSICCLFVFINYLFLNLIYGQGSGNYINFHLKNETYQNGKIVTRESDYYFSIEKGDLVVHGFFPKEHIKISNRLGEVKIFYPNENLVSFIQNQFFSSENELIYYFLSNNFYDLGLTNEGFSVTDTRMDGIHQIVTWTAPVVVQAIARVELVFEEGHPIYAAYYNINNKIIRKIFYYNYEIFRNFIMPMKVTQISYLSEKDSVIQRNTWSSMKTSSFPSSEYFNFKIPENAKIAQ